MRRIDLKNRWYDIDGLLSYGFIKSGDGYVFERHLEGYPFFIRIAIQGLDMTCQLMDDSLFEEFEAVDASLFPNPYVASLDEVYQKEIDSVLDACMKKVKNQTERIVEYISLRYQDEPEFLWKKFPEDSIVRRKDNRKWYGLFLLVEAGKLQLDGDVFYPLLDLRGEEAQIKKEDNRLFFPGYHMNKKHWYFVVLDERMDDEKIQELIDVSYRLAK